MTQDLSDALSRNIPLHEMIETLRQELSASVEAGRDTPLRFELAEIELELCIELTRGNDINAGVKFWVVNADAKHSHGDSQKHTFRLKLKPLHRGGPLRVGDQTDKLIR